MRLPTDQQWTRLTPCLQIDWTVSVDSTINRAHQHGYEHGPAGEGHRRCHLPQHERSSCDRG
jgi:hypothetical protein